MYKHVTVCFQGHITTYPIASWIVWNGGSCDELGHGKRRPFNKLFVMATKRKFFDIKQPWCTTPSPPNFTKFPSVISLLPLEDKTMQSFVRYYKTNANNASKYCIITLSWCKSTSRNKCQDQVLKGWKIFRALVINYKSLLTMNTLLKISSNP